MHPAICLPICKYSNARMFEKCFTNNTTNNISNNTNSKQYNNNINDTTCQDLVKEYESCILANIKNINDDTKNASKLTEMQKFALLFVV